MGGNGPQKPIVFVFGTQKDDADGRKRNLSAINTQVAYRAHEQRRAKKTRQRAAVKEEVKTKTTSASTNVSKSTRDQASNSHQHQFIIQEFPGGQQPQQKRRIVERQAGPLAKTPSFSHEPESLRLGKPIKQEYDEFSVSSASEHDGNAIELLSTPSSSELQLTPTTPSDYAGSIPRLNSYFETTLDPFFKLPQAISDRERWMVHYYFREMGHIGFGTHHNAMFCPDRDWVSTYVSGKSLCLQWILIHVEEYMTFQGLLSDSSTSSSRRAQAYSSLSSAVSASKQNLDRAIAGMMFAAILDFRQTSLHLRALDRLLEENGGFAAFLHRPPGTVKPEHIATVYAFGECPVPSLDDVKRIQTRFFTNLHSIHAHHDRVHAELRRLRNRRPWDSLSSVQVDSNGTLVNSTHDEHFRYYIKACADTLLHDCIAPLLDKPFDPHENPPNQVRHLALLLQIHTILLEFDGNGNEANAFLAQSMFFRRLQFVAKMSTGRDPKTGKPLLNSAGMLLINSFVREEVQMYIDRTKVHEKGVSVSQAVVDGIKAFHLLGDTGKSWVIEWLRTWLKAEEDEAIVAPEHQHSQVKGESMPFDESALAILSAEMSRNWYIKQKEQSSGTISDMEQDIKTE